MYTFTMEDVINYMETNGKESAYGLLLLIGPDGFDNHDDYNELENLLRY